MPHNTCLTRHLIPVHIHWSGTSLSKSELSDVLIFLLFLTFRHVFRYAIVNTVFVESTAASASTFSYLFFVSAAIVFDIVNSRSSLVRFYQVDYAECSLLIWPNSITPSWFVTFSAQKLVADLVTDLVCNFSAQNLVEHRS